MILAGKDNYMLIKDVTFLKDSQLFNINDKEQKQVDLVLVKLIQPQGPKKIRPGIFFINTGQKIFSMRHSKTCQLKEFYNRFVVFKGKTILREIIFYGKKRSTPETTTFCDQAIYGTVRNPITKNPLFNVNIVLYPLRCSQPLVSTISNASGDYLIESLPAGAYRITASKLGYYLFRTKFTIESNRQFSKIDIQLFPKSNMNCKWKTHANRMESRF
jgi:hypothetical protein